jgi:hypothetical protein
MLLTDDYLAVWADEAADGSVELNAAPIQALGVARGIRKTYEQREGQQVPSVVRTDHATDIVGLELKEGYWTVINESENFAGLCRKGEDIYQAIGCLNGDYRGRLKRPEVPAGAEKKAIEA